MLGTLGSSASEMGASRRSEARWLWSDSHFTGSLRPLSREFLQGEGEKRRVVRGRMLQPAGRGGRGARRAAELVQWVVGGAVRGAESGAVDSPTTTTGPGRGERPGAGQSQTGWVPQPGLRRTSSPSTKPNEYFGKTALTFQGGDVHTGPSVTEKGRLLTYPSLTGHCSPLHIS